MWTVSHDKHNILSLNMGCVLFGSWIYYELISCIVRVNSNTLSLQYLQELNGENREATTKTKW